MSPKLLTFLNDHRDWIEEDRIDALFYRCAKCSAGLPELVELLGSSITEIYSGLNSLFDILANCSNCINRTGDCWNISRHDLMEIEQFIYDAVKAIHNKSLLKVDIHEALIDYIYANSSKDDVFVTVEDGKTETQLLATFRHRFAYEGKHDSGARFYYNKTP